MQINCLAQNSLDSISAFYITVTPTALFNYHQGIQGGGEMGINGFGYLEAEGTVFFRADFYSASGPRKGGRLKLTYKFPLTKSNDIKLMLSAQYRKSIHEIMDDFDRGGGTFFQTLTYEQTRKFVGGTLGFSYCKTLGNLGLVEFGARVGGGSIDIASETLPLDAIRFSEITINGRFLDGGKFITPIAGISVKFKFNVF